MSLAEEHPKRRPTLPDHLRHRSLYEGHKLTERRIELLTLLAQGLLQTEARPRMGIGERGIVSHLFNINNALGTETPSAAVFSAIQHGLVDPEVSMRGFCGNVFEVLSPGQLEILETMTRNHGETSTETAIGETLHCTPADVLSELKHILTKLGARNSTQAGAMYLASKQRLSKKSGGL